MKKVSLTKALTSPRAFIGDPVVSISYNLDSGLKPAGMTARETYTRASSFSLLLIVLLLLTIFCPFCLAAFGENLPSTVTVDNTKSNPVHVTGDVSLSGNPTVTIGDTISAVPVTGTVGLSGTPTVIIGNHPGQPIPVIVFKKTSQLLGMTQFNIPQNSTLEIATNIDVSSCSEVRFSSRTIKPTEKYPVYCRLYDSLTGALLSEGSSTFDNSQTMLIETPTASGLTIRCINYDPSSVDIKAALYCR